MPSEAKTYKPTFADGWLAEKELAESRSVFRWQVSAAQLDPAAQFDSTIVLASKDQSFYVEWIFFSDGSYAMFREGLVLLWGMMTPEGPVGQGG